MPALDVRQLFAAVCARKRGVEHFRNLVLRFNSVSNYHSLFRGQPSKCVRETFEPPGYTGVAFDYFAKFLVKIRGKLYDLSTSFQLLQTRQKS